MMCRHLCGCVTWHGETRQTDVFVCDARVHSGSFAPMREDEIASFFVDVCKILGYSQAVGLWAAKLGGDFRCIRGEGRAETR